ncbi:NAD(P)/FAD-dependent oxidoreductase [Modestobacter sp. I12A-02628]|uniref:Oxidoreductase n=1 Tax=Goekera deserti TaxID=2497753 RepID=A0A7K3WHP1_9ACTN|nr:FAD-dependent oxidoreductase [Goekera deserti]MPQ96494.1 NAD(P)/FAD-dependent oxidoreductase [Goekera deserti]NDI47191.1 FAD-dependent oxidoreductase [Goekera deserti]NEL55409.1 oxidoreductase [Goekera deserti]
MSTHRADVVVVGAGHAGVQLAVALATSAGPRGVLLLGAESGLPYERPPLTKKLLVGSDQPVPVPLRSAAYWDRSPVTLRTGTRVVSVDPDARTVGTDAGETIGYRDLVWATGGRAARCGLPGEDLRGVHSIRDLADLTALRRQLAGGAAARAVVVGGGYVGLEVAAGLRQLGLAVTLVEVAPRLLARVTGTVVSAAFTALHRRRGVDVRLGTAVTRLRADGDRVAGVVLADGTELAADVVVVGVGMRPEVDALLAAGARGDTGGVDVDEQCRTSLPGVLAVGDCARQANPWSATGAAMRVESVHNAGLHAAAAARALTGRLPAGPVPPRFWSTQYGVELRTVGLSAGDDEQVLRGDPATGSFSVAYLRGGRLAALDTVDRPRDFARGQALVAAAWQPTRAELIDPDTDLPRLQPAGTSVT